MDKFNGVFSSGYDGYSIYMFLNAKGHLRYYVNGSSVVFTKELHAKRAIDLVNELKER